MPANIVNLSKPNTKKAQNMRDKISRNKNPQKLEKLTEQPTSIKKTEPIQTQQNIIIDETTLERKEIRISSSMNYELRSLRQRLNKERKEQGIKDTPSITDRILARVALRLLMEHQEKITGSNEEELLASLKELTSNSERH